MLTALVQIYGLVLFGTDFAPVLERIAECGAVGLLQQLVFAESADMAHTTGTGVADRQAEQVAARLEDVLPMFEALCRPPAQNLLDWSDTTRGTGPSTTLPQNPDACVR
ncbi:hypothetical protein [Caballeronia cordobensis]|uniref:hypothetical protein n=1 Tax=Caballeronia cordobensis TaxID=1353886 RepID=UPI0006AD6D93|nr:hypothetical protein [Caballeronia cordobensis]